MAGRGDDGAPADPAGSAARRAERPSSGRGTVRTVALGTGLLLAAAATVAVFATDDPRYLRIAVLAACWAFLVAAFVAEGPRPDQAAAGGREDEPHRADQPPGEVEDGMRRELAALRAEIASLAGLRENVAALAEVRGELAALGRLRGELSALTDLRAELGQLRGELSGDLLIERMVLRGHGPSSAGARPAWNRRPADDDEPVRLIASPPRSPVEWPADRSPVRVDGPAPLAAAPDRPLLRPPPTTARRTRHPVEGAGRPPVPAPPWTRPGPGAADAGSAPAVQQPRWPAEEVPAWALAEPSWKRAQELPAEDPAPSGEPSWSRDLPHTGERAGVPSASAHGAAPAQERPQDAGHDRLARILAENGVDAGSRRHRRRAADEAAGQPGDDVLSRVLGRR
jgi:hypothetical protein